MYQIFSEHQRKIAMACRVRDQGEHGDRERRGGVRRGLGRGQEQRVQPAAIWHDWLPGEHHHCPGLSAPPGSPRASQGFHSPQLIIFCNFFNSNQHFRSSMESMSPRYLPTLLQRVRKFTRGRSLEGPELNSTPRWRVYLEAWTRNQLMFLTRLWWRSWNRGRWTPPPWTMRRSARPWRTTLPSRTSCSRLTRMKMSTTMTATSSPTIHRCSQTAGETNTKRFICRSLPRSFKTWGCHQQGLEPTMEITTHEAARMVTRLHLHPTFPTLPHSLPPCEAWTPPSSTLWSGNYL